MHSWFGFCSDNFVCLLFACVSRIIRAMDSPRRSHASRMQALSPSPLSPIGRKAPVFHSSTGDRFIPNRGAMDLSVAHFNLLHETKENHHSGSEVVSPVREEYRRMLAENLLYDCGSHSPKILAFKKRPSLLSSSIDQSLSDLDICDSPSKKFYRQVNQAPEKILDAPDIADDYYLNLLDWSCTNLLAVALGPAVYVWDAENGGTHKLTKVEGDDMITSVSWAEDGRHIAVGLNSSSIQVWDVKCHRQVRCLEGHCARVSCLSWNGALLSSGGRDNKIINHDVRARNQKASAHYGHTQEVCGLKWSPSGQQLASGGNDNLLFIWDAAMNSYSDSRYAFRWTDHQAAVKALAWCPFQSHLLASGGGTVDRCIKFWNTQTGICLNSVDTFSQVCALQWSRHQKEILSSHGYSLNQLCVWKYPSMVKVAELRGHSSRVLHLAQSPDGTTVASAAADETLRLWKVFPMNKQIGVKPTGLLKSISIR